MSVEDELAYLRYKVKRIREQAAYNRSISSAAGVYRGVIIRAVTGESPAHMVAVADDAKLNAMCEQLARVEKIADLLCHKGYDTAGMDIVEIVSALPVKEPPRTK